MVDHFYYYYGDHFCNINPKIVRVRGGRGYKGNRIFQTQHGRCIYGWKEAVTASQELHKLSQTKSQRGGGAVGAKSHPLPRAYS